MSPKSPQIARAAHFLRPKAFGRSGKLPGKNYANWHGIVILIDTDVMVEFLRGSSKTAAELAEIGANKIAISAVTRMELLVGAANAREVKQIEKSLAAILQVSISESISAKAIELIKKYAKSHGLKIPDGIIAATAMDQSLDLFTYNVRDFKFIEGLTLHS